MSKKNSIAARFMKSITTVSQLEPVKRSRALSGFLRKIRAFAYAGDQYECPYCNGKFSQFLSYGNPKSRFQRDDVVPGVYRENVLCPACDSLERERLIKLYLERKTDILNRKTKALHVAPERKLEEFLSSQPHVEYVSMDISNKAMLKADLTSLGIRDSTFDVIICSHVLEHVADDLKAMAELNRIIRPDGWAILQVPIAYSLEKTIEGNDADSPDRREELFGQKNHVRLYGRDYFERLQKSGLSVREISPGEIVGESLISRYGLNPKENLFVCSKN
jgi:SAM-dependent methyltransferase